MKKMWRDSQNIKTKSLALVSFIKRLMFLYLIILAVSCGNKKSPANEDALKYTCPMHPQIIKNEPGVCPICKMDLVAVHHQNIDIQIDTGLKSIIKPTHQAIISNIKTFTVSRKTLADTISLYGKIDFNTNNLYSISSRISGRIEKLYVHYNFEKIIKGQKIMEIYSPELASAQQELLFLNKSSDVTLIKQSKQKLSLLGVSESQINKILRSGKVNYKIPIYSSSSGYLVDFKTISNDNEKQDMNTNNVAISLLEGQYVQTGDVLFKLFNNQQVWAEFFVETQQMESIKKDHPIQITAQNDTITRKIDLIQAYYNSDQKLNVVRSYLNNTNQKFRVGQLIKGQVYTKPTSGLYIPEQAVYQAGTKNIVFIKNKNILLAKEVILSSKVDSFFLIQSGLKEGDEVAINASYLIDTESFIKTN